MKISNHLSRYRRIKILNKIDRNPRQSEMLHCEPVSRTVCGAFPPIKMMRICPIAMDMVTAPKSQFRVTPSRMFNLLLMRRLVSTHQYSGFAYHGGVEGTGYNSLPLENLHPNKSIEHHPIVPSTPAYDNRIFSSLQSATQANLPIYVHFAR